MPKVTLLDRFEPQRFNSVQATAQLPMITGAVAHGYTGGFRFDYILGEDGKALFGEDNNTLIKES